MLPSAASIILVLAPAKFLMSLLSPIANMRPFFRAKADALGRFASKVTASSFKIIKSGYNLILSPLFKIPALFSKNIYFDKYFL